MCTVVYIPFSICRCAEIVALAAYSNVPVSSASVSQATGAGPSGVGNKGCQEGGTTCASSVIQR